MRRLRNEFSFCLEHGRKELLPFCGKCKLTFHHFVQNFYGIPEWKENLSLHQIIFLHNKYKMWRYIFPGKLMGSPDTVGANKNCTLRFSWITQPKMHQFKKSLCPSSRGGPEDSKTPPTCKVWIILSQVMAI